MTARPARRFQPFPEFDQLQAQMGELLESALSGEAAPWVPAVDIEETDDAWVVEAELPGVRKEDVNVEVRGSELSISGEVKEREREGVLRRRTRRIGEFDYHVTLPGEADAEHIEAHLDDGVLTVRIPKPEQARARRIDVDAAPQIAARYGAQSIPLLVLFRDGEPVDRLVGAVPERQLREWLDPHLIAVGTG